MDNSVDLKRDFWFGVATIAFSIFMFFSIRISISEEAMSGISGRVFPYIIDFFLFILGIALCLDSKKHLSLCENGECIDAGSLNKKQKLDLFIYIAMVAIYILSITYIGFITSSVVFISILLWFYGVRKPIAFIFMSIFWPLFLWVVFHVLIEVQFPNTALFI